jgi:hypothetical protein
LSTAGLQILQWTNLEGFIVRLWITTLDCPALPCVLSLKFVYRHGGENPGVSRERVGKPEPRIPLPVHNSDGTIIIRKEPALLDSQIWYRRLVLCLVSMKLTSGQTFPSDIAVQACLRSP